MCVCVCGGGGGIGFETETGTGTATDVDKQRDKIKRGKEVRRWKSFTQKAFDAKECDEGREVVRYREVELRQAGPGTITRVRSTCAATTHVALFVHWWEMG